MNCPSCQHENRPDAVFCSSCGEPLSVICASCGRSNPLGSSFCDSCGTHLSESRGGTPAPELDPRSHTPKRLADKILQSKPALEGERKQVTVLFADVKGSTTLQETLDAERWHRIMARFHRVLAEGVHRYEGTVNDVLGDGIMALFGAPIAHEDHARRACYAALRMRNDLAKLADELRAEHGLALETRMGLNSGEVVIGKIGTDLRAELKPFGHAVPLAQSMEAAAEPGEVFLTEHTARLVEGFFDLDEVGLKDVKGAREPVRVYALKGVGRIRTRLELSQTRGLSAFVGREQEVSVLDGALEKALEGNGQIVGVVGEAGVGKSRLCLEFVLRCQERGLRVNEAHCPPHGKTEPFGAILQLLRGAFRLREDERDASARLRVEQRLAELGPAFDDSLPLVFDFLGMPDPERPVPPYEPQARQLQLRRFVGQLVQTGSRREPVVVLLDDAHWIDEPSDGFLAAIAESVRGTRTLLLVNFRPEYSADWMRGTDYQQLPLRPLGSADAEALLQALLGEWASSSAFVERIRDHTGGNPFFIEEVVQSLVESGVLEGDRGDYRLVQPVALLSIPSTVQAVLAARIDRLPEREKRLLQVAATIATIGRDVPEALLQRVSGLADTDMADALDRLRRAEFLYEAALYPEPVHAFKHPLTREVAYDAQLSDLRERTHAAAARALTALHGAGLESTHQQWPSIRGARVSPQRQRSGT